MALESSAEGRHAPPGREWSDLAPRSEPRSCKEEEPAAELVLGCDAGADGCWWWGRPASAAALVVEEAPRLPRLRLGEGDLVKGWG